jgi:hypothetical protein
MPKLPKPDSRTGILDEVKYAKYSDDLWRSYDSFYKYAQARWERVIHFLRGNHWRVLEHFDLEQLPAWKRHPVIGLTLGIYDDLLSQWLQSTVRFSAVPTSADYEDIYRAEMAEQLLSYLWELTDASRHKIDLGAWLLATGNGTILTYWNTDTGNLLPLATPEMAPGPNGQPAPTGKLIPINPNTMQPDPGMQEPVMMDAGEIAMEVVGPDMARWGQKPSEGLMVGKLLTYDEAEDLYGKEVAEKLQYQNRDASLDLSWVTMPKLRPTEDQRALVIRHYLPRSFRHPDGLWWEASGDTLLVPPTGIPGKRVPGVPFRWIPVQGYHAYGLSPLYEVTFSNKAKDAVRARQEEWMYKVLPKLLLMNGGGVTAGEFNDEPMQEIEGVNPGAAPSVLIPPGFPQELVQMDRDATDDAMFATGYQFRRQANEPVTGSSRAASRSPKLQEVGELKLALQTAAPAWAEVGRVLLGFVGEYYTEQRTVAVMGPDRSYQWLTFKGTDFKNLAASIKVDEIPLYPWARQTLRDSVVSLLQTEAGQVFFTDASGQLDREKLQAAAEAVGVDVALSTLSPDVNEARNEVSQMRAGQPVEYKPYQQSDAHLTEKLKVVKSLAFKGWPQEAQSLMLQNIDEHKQALQQQQEKEENKLLKQELALRTIRSQVETQGAVKEELAKVLLDIVKDIMNPTEPVKGKE